MREQLTVDLDALVAQATPLPTPEELNERHHLETGAADIIRNTRGEVVDIMRGRDPRLIAVVGPCSMDESRIGDEYSALKFADELQELSQRPGIAANLLTIMRCPPTKPRTNLGRRGLEQSDIDLSHHLTTAIANKGIPLASEVMTPAHMARYGSRYSLAWVGARNNEDTQIRHTLSAYSNLPVFVKNNGAGDMQPAIDAADTISQGHPHAEIMMPDGRMGMLEHSDGNPNVGLLWRAGSQFSTPDLHREGLITVSEMGRPYGIDMSHGGAVAHDPNNKKSAEGQRTCLDAATKAMMGGVLLRQPSMIMIEGYLAEGADTSGNTPGMSVTDPCVSIGQLGDMLEQLSEAHANALTRG